MRFKLTRAGWLFLLLAAVLAVASLRARSPVLYLIPGAMFGTIVTSAFISRSMIGRLRVRRELPDRLWQNQTLHLGYFVRHGGRRGAALGITIEEIAPQGISSVSGYCVHVPAGGVFRAGGRFVARRRGRISLTGLRLSTTFPLGLLLATRVIPRPCDLIVWPARGRLRRPVLRRGASESSTAAPAAVTGGQDEFFGVREFREGDSTRWVHWRKSAGRPVPVIREMSHPRPDMLYIVVDACGVELSEYGVAQRERLLRLAATLVEHALVHGWHVGLAVAGESGLTALAPGVGTHHRRLLLDALAGAGDGEPRPLAQVVEAIPRRHVSNAQALVLASSMAMRGSDALATLRRTCRHVSTIGYDRLDLVFDDPLTPLEPLDASGAVHAR